MSPNLPRFHSYDLEVGPKDGRRVVLRESLRWAPEGRIRMRRIFEREGNAIVAAPELGTKGQEQLLNAVRDNASVVSTLAQLNNMLCQRICTDLSNNVRTNFSHEGRARS